YALRAKLTTAGDDAFAVGAERGTQHCAVVSIESEDLLARRGVPNLRRFVPASGEDAPPVGAERRAPDQAGVSDQGLSGVDSRPKVAMLPAAQARLALVQITQRQPAIACFKVVLGQHELAGIEQPLGPGQLLLRSPPLGV